MGNMPKGMAVMLSSLYYTDVPTDFILRTVLFQVGKHIRTIRSIKDGLWSHLCQLDLMLVSLCGCRQSVSPMSRWRELFVMSLSQIYKKVSVA